jgi:hypothetical protein
MGCAGGEIGVGGPIGWFLGIGDIINAHANIIKDLKENGEEYDKCMQGCANQFPAPSPGIPKQQNRMGPL